MNKLKIVDFSTFSEEFTKELFEGYMDYSRFDFIRAEKDMSLEDKCELVKDADILLSDPAHMNPILQQIIRSAKKLRLVRNKLCKKANQRIL